ncbi:MAG: regulatory iron-sulfur-containing complex subunit RicT [Coriobacteriia bacterium]|nr:regulatory iron-sulfur-containing complex subunit RicT [Coriobacteriia bacterium]
MPTVVGVILRNAAKPELFDAGEIELAVDDVAVVSTERGEELGRVAESPRDRASNESLDAANRVVRVAAREDLECAEELHAREKAAMPVYRRLVEKHKLDMKPTDVEFLFDGARAVFYFVAEERVDFRELVRDLAAEFHVRVDMRQIGVRDEARMIGGLGHCGEQLCCDRFGGEFQPVSIRMAKEQDLPLNPLKISGLCGRLMCCLRYEYDAYKDFKTRAPKKGAIIDVGGTLAKVVEMNTPRERITMRKEDGTRVTFGLDEMECCSGQGCPCSIKAEALERSIAALTMEAPSSGAPLRERKLTESGAARSAVVAPSEGASTTVTPESSESGETSSSPSKRRRRRRGGGGGGEAAAGSETPKAAPAEKKKSGRGSRQPGGSAAPAPAPAAGADAPARRKRRRRRGAGGTGAGEASST